MNDGQRARCLLRAEFLKALSHPVRLLILEKTAERPRCIAELAALTGKNEATISKHVAMLKEAGCLASERKGLHVFCSVVNPELARIWEVTDRCIRQRFQASGRSQARVGLRAR